MGNVYFIRAASVGMMKIGHGDDVAARLAKFRTGSPIPLELVWSYPITNSRGHERAWHRMFHKSRRDGEWFQITSRMLNAIEYCKETLSRNPHIVEWAHPLDALTDHVAQMDYQDINDLCFSIKDGSWALSSMFAGAFARSSNGAKLS